MNQHKIWLVAVLLTALLVASCGVEPTPGGPPTAPPAWPSQAQPLVDRAIADLGCQSDVNQADITVILVEEVDWPNSCLGCPKADEVCLQVITPGYRIVLQAGDQQYEYRTDRNDLVRRCPSEWGQAQWAVDRAVIDLALDTQVELAEVVVVLVEQVEWPDSCLGCPQPDEMCLEVITPGYRLVLQVGHQQYEYRTDMDDAVRFCPREWGEAEPQVQAAVSHVQEQLDAQAADVVVVRVEEMEWPNSCLGCPERDEVCLEVITPGYRIVLQSGDQRYEYRTDGGDHVMLCTDDNQSGDWGPAQLQVEKARADLAGRLNVAKSEVAVASVEKKEWSDSSLGCPQPGHGYLMVITPGYRILLEAQGQQYAYHTDLERYFVLCEK